MKKIINYLFKVAYIRGDISTKQFENVYNYQVITRAIIQFKEYKAQRAYEKMMDDYYG